MQEKVTDTTVDNRQPEFIRKKEKVTDTTIEARQPDFSRKAGKSLGHNN